MRGTITFLLSFFLIGCIPPNTNSTMYYRAKYTFSLFKVERPEKSSQRYGSQKIDTLSEKTYKFYFEDDLVRTLWSVSNRSIAFSIKNKTEHSIKILWDDAAFIDQTGSSHRVVHSGIKINQRQQQQAPSIIARQSSIEDNLFSTDHVTETTLTNTGWIEVPFFVEYYYSTNPEKTFATFEDFDRFVKSNVGKTIQALLPLQVEEVINDYIFSFKVVNVTTTTEKSSYNF